MQKRIEPFVSPVQADYPTISQRIINYLRLSVTDRCNLRCVYCMPEEGASFLPRSDILSYEELLYIVNLCVVKGIRKIRLTGGEPLVRNGIISFVERLHRISGLEEISLTTNGVFLKDFAGQLKKCGIRRINVSMDTLRPERFGKLPGVTVSTRPGKAYGKRSHVACSLSRSTWS